MYATCGIVVGDLVTGTSMHNYGLVGIVINYDPNRADEFKVHWMVDRKYTPHGFYPLYERFYDLEKIS